MSDVLLSEDPEGLRLWPKHQVAALSPAYPRRWRVVGADGSLSYRPEAPPEGPWVRLGDSWVYPPLLRREGDRWIDPAGFDHGDGDLPVLSVPADDPRWALEQSEEHGPGWWTDQGFEPVEGSLEQAAAAACLVRTREATWVVLSRIRRLVPDKGRVRLILDNGQQRVVSEKYLPELAAALGQDDFRHLHPYQAALFHLELREFPRELSSAPADYLRRHFAHPRPLIANFLWQALHYRQLGLDMGYGTTHDEFFYLPLSAALSRRGFMRQLDPLSKAKAERYYEGIVAEMVGKERLFTFEQLGFEDSFEHRREIGALHPRVVLLVEKSGLAAGARTLARRYGISLVETGGVPNLIEVEYFLKALGGEGPIVVVAYVDWDPGGYWAAHTLINQCLRYGVACAGGPHFLVRPEAFSAEELELYSRGLDEGDSRATNWVGATGGIGGQARGIHCEWLRPFARVEKAMAGVMGALGVG